MRLPRRLRSDRGSALVELAFVLPMLCILVFGTTEMGLAWVAKNRVSGAVAQAARIGASEGNLPATDRDILLTLKASLPAEQLAALDRVVVFNANDPSGTVPGACTKSAGNPSEVGTSTCNSYTGATVRTVSAGSMAGFTGGPGGKDGYWPPAHRKSALLDPPDYIGVWLRTSYSGITGFGFAQVTMTTSSIFRIQPDLSG